MFFTVILFSHYYIINSGWHFLINKDFYAFFIYSWLFDTGVIFNPILKVFSENSYSWTCTAKLPSTLNGEFNYVQWYIIYSSRQSSVLLKQVQIDCSVALL